MTHAVTCSISIEPPAFTQTVLIAVLILIILDIFISGDVLTHLSYVAVASLAAFSVHGSFLIQILAGLCAWFAAVAFHYLVWRKTVSVMVNRYIAPDRHVGQLESLVGCEGVVDSVGDAILVSIRGSLWPSISSEALVAGLRIRVEKIHDGMLVVKIVEGRKE